MAAKRGLGDNAVLNRRGKTSGSDQPTTEKKATGSIVAALGAGHTGDGPMKLPVARIAHHPENPRGALRDLDGLAASIKAVGLLQAVMVVPVDVFRTEREDLADQIGDVDYVLVAGHRRHAAHQVAKIKDIEAVIAPSMAGAVEAARAFAHENLNRDDLNPLEEAQAFKTLVDHGESQRKIAAELGVSQGHVSKRLSLLTLPQPVQDALLAGDIVIGEALEIAAVKADLQAAVWEKFAGSGHRRVDMIVRDIENEEAREKARQEALTQIENEGLEHVEPYKRFGMTSHRHQLIDKKAIDRARKQGTLVATATDFGVRYYDAEGPQDAPADREKIDARESKKANKGRNAACAQLVGKSPSKTAATEALVEHVLGHASDWARDAEQVRKWLKDLISVPEDAKDSYYGWMDAIRGTDAATQRWVAWAMTVANAEASCKATYLTWGGRQVEHLDRLINEAGYQPTEWEQKKLDAARKTIDSDGITNEGDNA